MMSIYAITKALSEKSGIPMSYDVEFTDLEKARKATGNPSFLKVFDADGKKHPYMDMGMRFDNPHRNVKAVKFVLTKYRGIADFGYEVKLIKKTKICEGGGWYTSGGIYEVEGMQFEM